MQLLVAVVNHEEHVDDVLAGFVELGITGATVLESKGMGRVLSREVPIFAGVRSLAARSRAENRTIFCVVSDDRAEAAMAMIQEVCGDLAAPGAGIAFTVPIGRVVGLSPELES
ncbi:MAG TPA: P-II family nitrogen regulator [Gemmatimonadaceae bacterium]|nr:P-II family nitrogen regulator [Gemmatimonadaceae bacterium]